MSKSVAVKSRTSSTQEPTVLASQYTWIKRIHCVHGKDQHLSKCSSQYLQELFRNIFEAMDFDRQYIFTFKLTIKSNWMPTINKASDSENGARASGICVFVWLSLNKSYYRAGCGGVFYL